MDKLIKENANLHSQSKAYSQEIKELTEIGNQHQKEIETLLKFNEQLLGIIERELNGQNMKSSDILSLQPISEKTEIESEMFQSQFPNSPSIANQAQRLLQKKSLTLTPDPFYERLNRPEPMSTIIREEQQSIDGDVESSDEYDSETEIGNLIKEFRKDIQFYDSMHGVNEILNIVRSEHENIKEFHDEIDELTNMSLEKLTDLKNEIGNVNPKEKFIEMFNELEVSEKVKKVMEGFIDSI